MISFRFHLVSLVAIFLALGLGVLTGTTVLNRGIVAQLERQTDQLATQSDELRETVRRLEAETAAWSDFGENAMEFLIGGRLLGTDVVLVTQDGTDAGGIGGVREALEVAGARLRLELSVGARMALGDDEDRVALAELVGGAAADSEDLTVQAAWRLADRLAFGIAETDVLAELVSAGFLVRDPEEPRPVGRPVGPDAVVVVVAGGEGDPVVDPADFLVPLVERLALDGRPVAASEVQRSDYPFVALIRDMTVADRTVTQDSVDRTFGEIGLILALEALVERGEGGHYGVKAGASQVIPAIE